MIRLVLAIAAVSLLGSFTQVQAGPITYTLASTATGALGASPFTDALVTVTLTGNTSTITTTTTGPDTFLVNPGSAMVNIAGVGTAAFTGSIETVSTFNDVSFFGTSAVIIGQLDVPSDPASLTGILGQFGAVFLGYDLQGPFGPVSGSGGVASGSQVTPHFQTTAGDLTWAIGQPLGTSTFTAASVPEPGTFVFLGAGLAAVVTRRRFKQRK